MTAIEELAATLRSLRLAFETLAVPWAVGGSLASAAYGEPRATNHVDVIAALDEAGASRLTALLGADFHRAAQTAVAAVRSCDSFNVIDERSFIKVDVFVPPVGPLGVGQLDRRRPLVLIGGETVP